MSHQLQRVPVSISNDFGSGGTMKDLVDRVSYWFEERLAALEERTEDATVPPMDQALNRLAIMCDSMKERLNTMTWRRAGLR
jgi:hypothetical protein